MQIKRRILPTLFIVLALTGVVVGCGDDDDDNTNTGTNPPPIATFESGSFNSGSTPNLFVHTFNTNGTVTYRCRLHAGMTGSVTVVAAPAGADSPTVNIGPGNAFNPPTVTVKNGSYVKWVATTTTDHTVTTP